MTSARGHVLPLVLVLLALSAAVLSRVCREGMADSLAARQEARDLQRRWGMLSCRGTLLPAAGGILGRQNNPRRSAASVAATITLGSQRFALLFGDEQAKASLNTIYQRQGRIEVERFARTAARARADRLAVQVRPMGPRVQGRDAEGRFRRVFNSWGQIFELRSPLAAASLAGVTRDLTCFGSGKLNWKRASPEALSSLFPGNPAFVRRLLALRASAPDASVDSILQAPELSDNQKQDIKALLTDSSEVFSLWIWPQDGPVDAQFTVAEPSDEGAAQVRCFSWTP